MARTRVRPDVGHPDRWVNLLRVDPRRVPAEHPAILMLVSQGDRMVDPRCTAALAQAFAATRIVHPDAGHDLTLDDPRWCTEQIAAWLESR